MSFVSLEATQTHNMHFPVPRTTQIIVERLKARAEKPHLCGQTCCGKLSLSALKNCMYDFGQHSGSSSNVTISPSSRTSCQPWSELDSFKVTHSASVLCELSHGGDVANAFGSLSHCESCCLSSRYQPAPFSLSSPVPDPKGEGLVV